MSKKEQLDKVMKDWRLILKEEIAFKEAERERIKRLELEEES